MNTLTPEETRAKWMEVYDTLVSMLPSKDQVNDRLGEGTHTWFSLMEMRTVRLGASRQSGKTQGLVNLLRGYPRAMLLVKNNAARAAVLETLAEGEDADGTFSRRTWATGHEPIMEIERLLEQLSWASHILIDDATYNQGGQGLVYRAASRTMPDVIVVMMG